MWKGGKIHVYVYVYVYDVRVVRVARRDAFRSAGVGPPTVTIELCVMLSFIQTLSFRALKSVNVLRGRC